MNRFSCTGDERKSYNKNRWKSIPSYSTNTSETEKWGMRSCARLFLVSLLLRLLRGSRRYAQRSRPITLRRCFVQARQGWKVQRSPCRSNCAIKLPILVVHSVDPCTSKLIKTSGRFVSVGERSKAASATETEKRHRRHGFYFKKLCLTRSRTVIDYRLGHFEALPDALENPPKSFF